MTFIAFSPILTMIMSPLLAQVAMAASPFSIVAVPIDTPSAVNAFTNVPLSSPFTYTEPLRLLTSTGALLISVISVISSISGVASIQQSDAVTVSDLLIPTAVAYTVMLYVTVRSISLPKCVVTSLSEIFVTNSAFGVSHSMLNLPLE